MIKARCFLAFIVFKGSFVKIKILTDISMIFFCLFKFTYLCLLFTFEFIKSPMLL